MALATPTTQDVSDTIIAQLEASISQTVPILPKAFTRVLAKVLAGVVVILYKYGGFVFLQLFVSSASMDETVVNGRTIRPLVEWGRLIGVGDPIAATRAEVLVVLNELSAGGKILAGQQLLSSDTQVIYQAITETPLIGGQAIFLARATYDPNDNGGAGTIGNLAQGATLQVVNGPPNVATTCTVFGTTTTASDAETANAYRARITKRFQQRPQGGAYADYRSWAEGVPGIVHAYTYKGLPGQVDVYVEADPVSSGSPDGIPTGDQITAVKDAIDFDVSGIASRRPVNAAVNVLPITRIPIAITVFGLAGVDDISAAQDEVTSGVDEFLRSREPFIVGLDALPRDDRITIAQLGGIVDGIVSSRGGTVTRIGLGTSGNPALTLDPGTKAKLSLPITWS